MRNNLLLFFFLSITFSSYGQLIGEWMVYPPFDSPDKLYDTGKQVFAVGSGSLMSYQKDDESVVLHSKLDGLSDSDITHMGYDRNLDQLVLVYANQNIDLISKGKVVNIPDFKEKIMTTSKKVNQMLVSDGKAYLATDFGGVVVDLKKKEIGDTYNFNEVKAICLFPAYKHLCLVKEDGLWICPDSQNNYDFSNWQRVAHNQFRKVTLSEKGVFLLAEDGIPYRLKEQWALEPVIPESFVSIKAEGNMLYCINPTYAVVWNVEQGSHKRIEQISNLKDVSSFSGRDLWVASEQGLGSYKYSSDRWEMQQDKLLPNAPVVKDPYDLDFKNGSLYMVTGGPFRTFDTSPGAVSIYQDGTWTNISELKIKNENQLPFNQLIDIKASPFEPNHFFVGSFVNGLYEFKGNEFFQLHKGGQGQFSSVEEDESRNHYWVSGLNFDPKGNLWAMNSLSDHQLRMKSYDGKWYKYAINKLGRVEALYPVMITRQTQQKWFLSYYNLLALCVYDDNGTYENLADDRSVYHNSLVDQDGNTHSKVSFRCLAEDLDGKIWVGTSIGPMIINNSARIFDSNTCIRPKISRNDGTGLADYLLDNTTVMCITVDAANRKWIGTSGNGIYLLSPDGLEVIHHFTTENSPLYSNEILSMVVDPVTGKVYIGCMGGMLCYQSDAVEGNNSFDDVYAYPNPVRPDFSGPVAITGLKSNTLIKITDINNNLIYQGYSLGGQFTWDALNKKGERIKSGIYLVYGTSEDGKEGVVTKVMFIN
ncbi:MAG: hypothetical protein ACRCSQ_03455 [Bacteroidales bacterium]